MGLITRKVSTKTPIRYIPGTKDELSNIIVDLLKQGITNLNCIDVSKITDMSYTFWSINVHSSVKVKDIDISEWNVSNVKNMLLMFAGCEEFNSDLSKWDVSNVEDMTATFRYCYEFNSDLSNWKVSNVNTMTSMFAGCKEFNSDLSHWDVSNVKFMPGMFYKCNEFNSNLSNWNVSNVQQMMDMFDGCIALMENKLIPAWYKFN